MKIKLLPCPFCGGEPRLLPQKYPFGTHEGIITILGYSIDCLGCGAMVKEVTKYKRQIARKWNARK